MVAPAATGINKETQKGGTNSSAPGRTKRHRPLDLRAFVDVEVSGAGPFELSQRVCLNLPLDGVVICREDS